MRQFDGLRPARLKVGVISAGRVGTALGVALERAEHVVVACSAVSHPSRQRAQRWLPDTLVLAPPDVAASAELLLLAVPDGELAGLVAGLAATGAVRPGTIVVHTSGVNGIGILALLTQLGCVPLAIHPAMTFILARRRTSAGYRIRALRSPRPTRLGRRSRNRWCWRWVGNRFVFGGF